MSTYRILDGPGVTIHRPQASVDTGQLVIVDPGYLTRLGVSDDVITDLLYDYRGDEEKRNGFPTGYFDVGHATVCNGLGVVVSTGEGDGLYDVEVQQLPNGRVKEVRIVFIEDDDPRDD